VGDLVLRRLGAVRIIGRLTTAGEARIAATAGALAA
jgi:hypothetical protein